MINANFAIIVFAVKKSDVAPTPVLALLENSLNVLDNALDAVSNVLPILSAIGFP